jgi:electron transport complex, rnfABCDGE type, G subunit
MGLFSKEQRNNILHLGLTLFLITAITALLLSTVNAVTSGRIAKLEQQKLDSALSAVIEGADTFEKVDYTDSSVKSSDNKDIGIGGVWAAKQGDKLLGYCVNVQPKGYGGVIETLVGVSSEQEIIGAQILSMSETSGIGTKIQSDDFLGQFIGKSGSVTAGGNVDIISGATKSSEAYIRGINAAITVVNSLAVGGE